MLYLHCGWLRTGTSSLQASLIDRRDRLSAAGIVYPDRWRPETGLTHHGLSSMLEDSLESQSAFDDFTRFLSAQAGRDVLLSAESLTGWLLSRERQDALLRLLDTAREVTPVRCAWTLRRVDEIFCSLWLRRMAGGVKISKISGQLRDAFRPGPLFDGMGLVEDALAGEVVYVKYDPGGAHNEKLLSALGVPPSLAGEIRDALERGPRHGARLTRKGAVAILHRDAISRRLGFTIGESELRELLFHRGFGFEGDCPYQPVDDAVRRELHEDALAAARERDFAPYLDFFADEATGEGPAPADLDTSCLSDDDLDRLASSLRTVASVS